MRRPGMWLLAVALANACGGEPFSYEGTPGAPVAVSYDGWVPAVGLTVNSGVESTFLVDTGSPLTIVDTTSFPEIPVGASRADLSAFGLRFANQPVAAWDLFSAPPGQTFDGILGGDVLRHFALGLDYKDGRGWLFDPYAGQVPAGLDVDVGSSMAVELAGGGSADLPQCRSNCVVNLPATRVLLSAGMEAQTEATWAFVDTGASSVVISEALYLQLEQDSPGRPRLDGVLVATADGPVQAFFTRVWGLELLGLGKPGDQTAAVADLPVLVLPGSSIFATLSAEVNRDVQVLIGGTLLRNYFVSLDVPARTLHLFSYLDPTHIAPDEYVSVGFTMNRAGPAWVVGDVYANTDAAFEGLARGEEIEDIAGTNIRGASATVVRGLLAAYMLGQDVPIGVRRGNRVDQLMILVEDLLPSFPPPN